VPAPAVVDEFGPSGSKKTPVPDPQAAPAAAVADEQPTFPISTVEGWGQTLNDADEMAQKQALAEILSYLARQSPPVRWQPDLAWIKDQKQPLLTHKEVKERTLEISQEHADGVSYQVQLTPQAYRKILENDRQLTMQERQLLLGKILAGVVAVFTAFAGYYRLEEATKGYYTNWLRLGALGLVAAVGAAIYLVG